MIGQTLEMPILSREGAFCNESDLDMMLAAIAIGDQQALKSLYDVLAPRLFAILLRMVRRREVAEPGMSRP